MAISIVVASVLGIITPFLTRRLFDDALFVSGGPRLGLPRSRVCWAEW